MAVVAAIEPDPRGPDVGDDVHEGARALDTLARVGQALADTTRRGILVTLVQGPAYPSELAQRLRVSRSVLSNHLACLRGCGFVTATYEGRRVRYDLAGPPIAEALLALSSLPLLACPQDGRP